MIETLSGYSPPGSAPTSGLRAPVPLSGLPLGLLGAGMAEGLPGARGTKGGAGMAPNELAEMDQLTQELQVPGASTSLLSPMGFGALGSGMTSFSGSPDVQPAGQAGTTSMGMFPGQFSGQLGGQYGFTPQGGGYTAGQTRGGGMDPKTAAAPAGSLINLLKMAGQIGQLAYQSMQPGVGSFTEQDLSEQQGFSAQRAGEISPELQNALGLGFSPEAARWLTSAFGPLSAEEARLLQIPGQGGVQELQGLFQQYGLKAGDLGAGATTGTATGATTGEAGGGLREMLGGMSTTSLLSMLPLLTGLFTNDPMANLAAKGIGTGASIASGLGEMMGSAAPGMAGFGVMGLPMIPGLIGALTSMLDAPSQAWQTFGKRLSGTVQGEYGAGSDLARSLLTADPSQIDPLNAAWRQAIENAGVGGFAGQGTGLTQPPGAGSPGMPGGEHDLSWVTFEPQMQALRAMESAVQAGAGPEARAQVYRDTMERYSGLAQLQDLAAQASFFGLMPSLSAWQPEGGIYTLDPFAEQVGQQFGGDIGAARSSIQGLIDQMQQAQPWLQQSSEG